MAPCVNLRRRQKAYASILQIDVERKPHTTLCVCIFMAMLLPTVCMCQVTVVPVCV